MTPEYPWSEIDEIHRIRLEIAAEYQDDVFLITQAAKTKMEQSGRKILTQSPERPASLPSNPSLVPSRPATVSE